MKNLVLANRSSQCSAELVSLERRRSDGKIVVISRVEIVVACELEKRAVELISTGLRYNQDLSTTPLTVLGAVGIRNNVKFAPSVDTEQLPASSAPG